MGLGINLWGNQKTMPNIGVKDVLSGITSGIADACQRFGEKIEDVASALETSNMVNKAMHALDLDTETEMQPIYDELVDILRYAGPEDECSPEMNAVYADMQRLCINMVRAGLVEEE